VDVAGVRRARAWVKEAAVTAGAGAEGMPERRRRRREEEEGV
jgi:hypothetical protein